MPIHESAIALPQKCPRNQRKNSRAEVPENAAPVTENQIGSQLKGIADPPTGTGPRETQNIMKQSAPIADATHMAIVEVSSRRCFITFIRLMATTFAAKTIRPVSFAKKSSAADKSEIAKQRRGDLLADHRIA